MWRIPSCFPPPKHTRLLASLLCKRNAWYCVVTRPKARCLAAFLYVTHHTPDSAFLWNESFQAIRARIQVLLREPIPLGDQCCFVSLSTSPHSGTPRMRYVNSLYTLSQNIPWLILCNYPSLPKLLIFFRLPSDLQ